MHQLQIHLKIFPTLTVKFHDYQFFLRGNQMTILQIFTVQGNFPKMSSSQPIVVGNPIITTVIFVPNLFLKIPAIAVAMEAPRAINPTIHENSVLVTSNPKSSDNILGAAGEAQPRVMPKINDPPYAEENFEFIFGFSTVMIFSSHKT